MCRGRSSDLVFFRVCSQIVCMAAPASWTRSPRSACSPEKGFQSSPMKFASRLFAAPLILSNSLIERALSGVSLNFFCISPTARCIPSSDETKASGPAGALPFEIFTFLSFRAFSHSLTYRSKASRLNTPSTVNLSVASGVGVLASPSWRISLTLM